MRAFRAFVICVAVISLSGAVSLAQNAEPFSVVPQNQRDGLAKRLAGYVEAHQKRNWATLYNFVSDTGRGHIEKGDFIITMSENHWEEFAQSPDLQTFRAVLSIKNADGYDVYGCAGAVREGERYGGTAEIHAVFEHEDWFFTGWSFRSMQDESCKELVDPKWHPESTINWNRPMQEVADIKRRKVPMYLQRPS